MPPSSDRLVVGAELADRELLDRGRGGVDDRATDRDQRPGLRPGRGGEQFRDRDARARGEDTGDRADR